MDGGGELHASIIPPRIRETTMEVPSSSPHFDATLANAGDRCRRQATRLASLSMDGCVACDLTSGRAVLPGGTIAREAGWVVEHCVGPLGLGTLVVKPERHVVHVADLTEEEAAAMGRLLQQAARIVTELCDPDQVYVSLWSDAERRPRHIHYVVQPVDQEAMVRHNAHGPKLQASMFDNDPPDPARVEEFAARAT